MAESIWAKIGRAVKAGVKATGEVLALVPKALIYPIKKPFASIDEMKHDATVSLKEAVGIDVPKEKREYDPPIEATQASEDLGVQITKQEKGKVSFLASRTLVGDVSNLSQKKLDQIKTELLNVTIFREENKVVVEVNVEKIINDIKTDLKNKGLSEKEIKKLTLQGIAKEVGDDLKKLAGITGGEFKVHTDRKLLHGIAEKLYRECDNQKQSFEIVRPTKPVDNEKLPRQSSESIEESFNMSNPKKFPFGKEIISPTENMQLSQGIEKQIGEIIGNEPGNFLGPEERNVPNKMVKPSSTPAIERNEEGKGHS